MGRSTSRNLANRRRKQKIKKRLSRQSRQQKAKKAAGPAHPASVRRASRKRMRIERYPHCEAQRFAVLAFFLACLP